MSVEKIRDRGDAWRTPLLLGLAWLLLELLAVLWDATFGPLVVLLMTALSLFSFLVLAFVRRAGGRTAPLVIAVLLCFASVVLFGDSDEVRANIRWVLGAPSLKAQVMEQPSGYNNTLKHIDWDGWGFAIGETTEYLVFDPSDSLKRTGAGLPCKVSEIRRLERDWYAVTFYTDETWDHCP